MEGVVLKRVELVKFGVWYWFFLFLRFSFSLDIFVVVVFGRVIVIFCWLIFGGD